MISLFFTLALHTAAPAIAPVTRESLEKRECARLVYGPDKYSSRTIITWVCPEGGELGEIPFEDLFTSHQSASRVVNLDGKPPYREPLGTRYRELPNGEIIPD